MLGRVRALAYGLAEAYDGFCLVELSYPFADVNSRRFCGNKVDKTMKRKYQITIGIVLILLVIGSIKSLWDIDIFIGAVSTGSALIVYGSFVKSYDFYHAALIRLMLCISSLSILSVALLIDKGQP